MPTRRRFFHLAVAVLALASWPLRAGFDGIAAVPADAPEPVPDASLYYYSGSDGRARVDLGAYAHLLAVKFKPEVSTIQARRILYNTSGVDRNAVPALEPGRRNFYWVPTAAGSTLSQAQSAASALSSLATVVSAYPAQGLAPGHIYGLTNELIVAFDSSQTPAQVAAILQAHNLTIVEELDTALYSYVARGPAGSNAQQLANTLVQTYGATVIDYAHPNYVVQRVPLVLPNDPLFNKQWHLHATNLPPQFGVLPDADVDAPESWDLNTGHNVTIAVVDTGIDLSHPDLLFASNGTDVAGGSGTAQFQTPDEKHATAVAGMAAARGNNALGVSGTCQGCSILPIRFLAAGATLGDEAQAFNYARIHGADVINNSWGPIDNIQPTLPPATQQALQACVTEGRGGLGIPIFFAVGNSGGPVPQNGYVNSPYTIAVGSSTNQDVVANYSSQSANLDFVAPSGDVSASGGVWTTDITGPLGYSASGDYTGGLAGTSFSSPQAAGIAAQMLSANPALTWTQVRDLMNSSTDIIDPAHSNWSAFYGHGKINARKAVQAALDADPTPPGTMQKTYTWPNNGTVNLVPGSTAFASVQIPDTGTIQEAKLRLTVNHPNHSQLLLKVKHPDGTLVTIWNQATGSVPAVVPLPAFNGKPLAGTYQFQAHVIPGGSSGSVTTLQLDMTYQTPPPTTTYGSGYPPQAIPDASTAGLTQYIWIEDSGPMHDVTLLGSITHPDIGQLRVSVIAPDGSQVTVHNQNHPGTANLTMNFPLTSFFNKNLHGSWRIVVQDLVAGVTGTLQNWSLRIGYTPDGCAPHGQWPSTDIPKTVPDNNPAGVTSTVQVNIAGTVNNSVGIYAVVTHPNVGGDRISLSLIHPDGTEEPICGQMTWGFNYCPYNSTGIQAFFTITGFTSKPTDGTWRLKVTDSQAGGGGTAVLTQWALHLSYLPSGCGSVGSFQFASTDVPRAIPDQNFVGVMSDLPVSIPPLAGLVGDVNVSVDIAHANVGDLKVYLVSPEGLYVLLHNRTGVGTANLVTTYDTLTAPVHPLSIYQQRDPNGVWKVWVVDEVGGVVGTINNWSLSFTTVTP